ncbi:MAG: sigma 54-interacting transcriptional regulator, partial [Thermodesulfobacteriota bacterium]
MDEIGDMPLSMQGRLLRVIQEKRIFRVGSSRSIQLDVRFITATNRDLKRAVADGRFREDLLFRLNVVAITLPPLAERKEDIPVLVEHFISFYRGKFRKSIKGMEPMAREAILNYAYPGNVRELQNIIERAVALAEGEYLTLRDLPSDLQAHAGTSTCAWTTLEEQQREYIRQVLQSTRYRIGEAARILGIPRTTLWRKMKKLGFSGP